jgi:hypothetical protein
LGEHNLQLSFHQISILKKHLSKRIDSFFDANPSLTNPFSILSRMFQQSATTCLHQRKQSKRATSQTSISDGVTDGGFDRKYSS